MKIGHKIERVIILTPQEVYAAVAAKHGLPSKPDEVFFDLDTSCSSQIVLVAKESYDQVLDDGS